MIEEQFQIMQIGILIGQDDPTLDIESFGNLEDLRLLLNLKYNINIVVGMRWTDVFKELKKGVTDKRYHKAMEII